LSFIKHYQEVDNTEDYKYPWKYTEEERPCGSACYCWDCKLPYGELQDMVLSSELWEKINPSQYRGSGILCPTCIANRLDFIGAWYKDGLYILKRSPCLPWWKKIIQKFIGR
jgi:hypothetical protein